MKQIKKFFQKIKLEVIVTAVLAIILGILFIVMPNELTAILKNTPKRGIYVITGDKEPFITQNQYELRYKQVLQAADVRYLSPHKCRHTYATYLVRGGADLPTIQALLGHAELSTTEIYIDIDISDKQKNIKKLKYK